MNNFFYDNSDYDLFKKALRSTKNEPVVISILSDDSSLRENSESDNKAISARKQMSSKFQASPFDKFFGPRKKRTDPVDMKDFSSWKNKNYRESEKQINETPADAVKFSFSDYLKSKTKEQKFNEEDRLKAETQKPIEQMSSSDENFKKFSLDSYLTKLEQETKARKDFEENEDLIDIDAMTSGAVNSNENQDENFASTSDVDIEDFTFGGDVGGEKFAIDREELDSVKARLEKKAREEENIKDKPTTAVISTEKINEIKGKTDEDDEFNLDKLGIEDDIERVNSKIDSLNKILQVTGDEETDTPKVEHQKFVEINKNFDEQSEEVVEKSDDETEAQKAEDELASSEETTEEGIVEPIKIEGSQNEDEFSDETQDGNDEIIVDSLEIPEETESLAEGELGKAQEGDVTGNVDAMQEGETVEGEDSEYKTEINKNADYLTRADFKEFTSEIVNKFSELYRERNGEVQPYGEQPYDLQQSENPAGYDQAYAQTGNQDVYAQQSELQAKIVELLEQNKKADQDVAEKLQLAELEKQRVAEEYEAKLRELETSMRQREEDAKNQAYIEKLKSDIKLKKSQNNFIDREQEIRETEKLSTEKQFIGEKLKTELKNNLNVSNLEMDKKLLECVNKVNKDANVSIDDVDESVDEIPEEEEVKEVKRPTRTRNRTNRTTRRRSTVSSRMRTRTPRRKIDSDIIGGIDFD